MAEWDTPQNDSGQPGASAPGQATDQGWLPGLQTEDPQPQHAQPFDQRQDGQQQVQPFVPRQASPGDQRPYVTGLTSAQQVWYTLQCIYFGMGYFAKIPAKKALQDYGMAELTSAEQTWYTIQCIFFGLGYFAKLPTAKALSEMPQFQTVR
jgi:hypothetical protein